MSASVAVLLTLLVVVGFSALGVFAYLLYRLNCHVDNLIRKMPTAESLDKLMAVAEANTKAMADTGANINRFLSFVFNREQFAPASMATGNGGDSGFFPYSDDVAAANEAVAQAKLHKLKVDPMQAISVYEDKEKVVPGF